MKLIRYSVCLITLLLIAGCGSSKKFTDNENKESYYEDNSSIIRVLLDEKQDVFTYTADEPVTLKDESKSINVSNGERIQFKPDGNKVKAITGNKEYTSKFFQIISEDKRSVNLNTKNYKGSFRIAARNNKIQVINTVTLEEYLKGVVPAEMPVGKGTDNYEALRAFTICARTYAVRKLNSTNNFDIYSDVRDQVYGGEASERTLSNKAVKDTRGLNINL